MDKRKRGLEWCKQVANYLKTEGHIIDGPFSKVIFSKGRKMSSHVDIFGVFDLISSKEGVILFHQVTALNILSNKRKKILKLGMKGMIWCHCKINGRDGYRRFNIDPLNTWGVWNRNRKTFWETSSVIL